MEWIGYDILFVALATVLVRGIGLGTTSLVSYNRR